MEARTTANGAAPAALARAASERHVPYLCTQRRMPDGEPKWFAPHLVCKKAQEPPGTVSNFCDMSNSLAIYYNLLRCTLVRCCRQLLLLRVNVACCWWP
mmetsp:Transcript_14125/g.37253  ORF Transcript_14125/g.37253 Transcript_14125/m.37253 type:complete len:99 (-) Transcript_14125:293-589(-)